MGFPPDPEDEPEVEAAAVRAGSGGGGGALLTTMVACLCPARRNRGVAERAREVQYKTGRSDEILAVWAGAKFERGSAERARRVANAGRWIR